MVMCVNQVVAVLAIFAVVVGSSPSHCEDSDSGTCVNTDTGALAQHLYEHVDTDVDFEEGSEAYISLLQTKAFLTKAQKPLPRPKAGSVVFDIGAAEGGSASEFRREWGAHVLAVEANYGFVNSYLKPQLENGTDRKGFTVLQAAVSDKDGEERTFYKGCNDYLSSMRKEWLTNATKFRFGNLDCFEETKVKTRTLDSLIQQYGTPSYIKVDTEGYEETCLAGLTKQVPLLSYEWSYPDTFLDSQRILTRLRDKIGMKSYSLMFGDTPYSHIPDDSEFHCLSELTADNLKDQMLNSKESQREGPMGMLFVAAELPLGGTSLRGKSECPEVHV